jgi:hypothetical protein
VFIFVATLAFFRVGQSASKFVIILILRSYIFIHYRNANLYTFGLKLAHQRVLSIPFESLILGIALTSSTWIVGWWPVSLPQTISLIAPGVSCCGILCDATPTQPGRSAGFGSARAGSSVACLGGETVSADNGGSSEVQAGCLA